jgi:hypothetical protein
MRKFTFDPNALEELVNSGICDRQKFIKIFDPLKDII